MDDSKKTISFMIPCHNERENVVPMSEAIVGLMRSELKGYDYELIFIDNCSTDGTRDLLRQICAGNIPEFVQAWEQGYKIVCGIKATSRENKFIRFLRTCYYKLIRKMSDVEQIEHFTGFGLYDKSFIEVLKSLDDPEPFIRGIVAELGYKRKDIPYEQAKRAAGKTHNNFFTLYDAAMLSFTTYTKVGLRVATILGFILSVLSLIVAVFYVILKFIMWDDFPAGMLPVLIIVTVLGSMQLFFIGLLGEYVMNINRRVIHRPLVIEEERINF